jgi:hypothetical protein
MAARHTLKYDESTVRANPRARPERVGNLLVAAVPALGPRLLERRIAREWPDLVGRQAAEHAAPRGLSDGTLRVVVSNSPWLQELSLRTGEILAKLEDRYGTAVAALRFSVGSVDAPRRRAPLPSPERAAPLSAAERTAIETLLEPVGDPDVAAAMRRLLVKDALDRRRRAAGAGPATGGSRPGGAR